MHYLYKQFQGKKKDILEVEIDRPTKVRVMTASEYKRYRNGRTFSFYGGMFDSSPVHFVLPHDGVWFAVVEKGGTYNAPGTVQASCKLHPPDRQVISSLAIDAPEHVRNAAIAEGASQE